jgi:hypothetical protein
MVVRTSISYFRVCIQQTFEIHGLVHCHLSSLLVGVGQLLDIGGLFERFEFALLFLGATPNSLSVSLVLLFCPAFFVLVVFSLSVQEFHKGHLINNTIRIIGKDEFLLTIVEHFGIAPPGLMHDEKLRWLPLPRCGMVWIL